MDTALYEENGQLDELAQIQADIDTAGVAVEELCAFQDELFQNEDVSMSWAHHVDAKYPELHALESHFIPNRIQRFQAAMEDIHGGIIAAVIAGIVALGALAWKIYKWFKGRGEGGSSAGGDGIVSEVSDKPVPNPETAVKVNENVKGVEKLVDETSKSLDEMIGKPKVDKARKLIYGDFRKAIPDLLQRKDLRQTFSDDTFIAAQKIVDFFTKNEDLLTQMDTLGQNVRNAIQSFKDGMDFVFRVDQTAYMFEQNPSIENYRTMARATHGVEKFFGAAAKPMEDTDSMEVARSIATQWFAQISGESQAGFAPNIDTSRYDILEPLLDKINQVYRAPQSEFERQFDGGNLPKLLSWYRQRLVDLHYDKLKFNPEVLERSTKELAEECDKIKSTMTGREAKSRLAAGLVRVVSNRSMTTFHAYGNYFKKTTAAMHGIGGYYRAVVLSLPAVVGSYKASLSRIAIDRSLTKETIAVAKSISHQMDFIARDWVKHEDAAGVQFHEWMRNKGVMMLE